MVHWHDSLGPAFDFVVSIALPGRVSVIRLKPHAWAQFKRELIGAGLYPGRDDVITMRGIPVLPTEELKQGV